MNDAHTQAGPVALSVDKFDGSSPWLPRPCFRVEAVDPHAPTGQKPRPGVQMWMLALPKKCWRFIPEKLQKQLGNHCLDYRIIATVLDPAKIG